MLSSPRVGQAVQIHYAKRKAARMPLHGRRGIVRFASRGPGPRNHGVDVDGAVVSVPAGNLRRFDQEGA